MDEKKINESTTAQPLQPEQHSSSSAQSVSIMNGTTSIPVQPPAAYPPNANVEPYYSEIKQSKYNTMAIIAICTAFFAPVLSPLFAVIALKQIKRTGEKGAYLAWASIPIVLLQALAVLFLILNFR